MGRVLAGLVKDDKRPAFWWADARILLWQGLQILCAPFLIPHKIRRFKRWEKFDEVNPARWRVDVANPTALAAVHAAAGPHIAFVGASFGELLLIQKLNASLIGTQPNLRTTWVLRDHHCVADVLKYHPNQSVVYWPFDSLIPVARFLEKVRPDSLVFIERYRFTTLLTSAKRFGVKAILINGRFKLRQGWFGQITRSYDRWLCSAFDTMLLQNEDYRKTAELVAPTGTEMRVTGDVKFDLDRKDPPADQMSSLDAWLTASADGPLLAAGSTDGVPEEEFVLDAFLKVRAEEPCRLLIAPRRPQRRDELTKLIEARGLSYSLRSQGGGPADVYVLDTLGELSYAYRHSVAAYVGGAFDGMGHNVIEPLDWGVPVSYGMRRGHFETMQKLCESIGVGFRIGSSTELADHWLAVLHDEALREKCFTKGREMIERQRGAFKATLHGIEESLRGN